VHQFVPDAPSGGVGHAEPAYQRQSRYIAFDLGERVRGKKPGSQWELRRSKDRPTDDEALVVTLITFVELPGVELAMTAGLALLAADETARPTRFIQCLFTLLFGTVRVQGLVQTEATLELHRIICHRKSSLSFRHFDVTSPIASVADLRQELG
jgi:hypothetical protein